MNKDIKIITRAKSIRSFVKGVIGETIKAPDRAVVFHITEQQMYEIITKKRLELIRIIKRENPKSIVELAKSVNRTKQAVNRDLKILEKNAVVKLKKRGKTVIPLVEKEAMIFSFSGAKQIEA